MASDNILIDDAAIHFAASRNRDYREQVRETFRVFIDFLQKNSLTTRQILAEDEPVTAELKIYKSDLTDAGFEVVKKGYDKWLRSHDRGKPISDVTILEKALKTVRAEMDEKP